MNFWIVAMDHQLQLTPDPSDTEKLRAQKERLETILRAGIPGREVRFIAEESKLGKSTIATTLANDSSPTIPWTNIIMTDAEREATGIAAALKHRQGHPDYDTMEFWIECRIPEDEIREDFFIQTTLQEAGDARSVLMLLGDLHVDAVAEKLGRLGHSVTTNHDLFPVRGDGNRRRSTRVSTTVGLLNSRLIGGSIHEGNFRCRPGAPYADNER